MIFNSIDFLIFLPIVFFLYWKLFNFNIKVQNAFIVFASYLFYGWWDWRFLVLIFLSTITDFTIGLNLKNEHNAFRRKILLWISIACNLGVLGFFKYYNFFIENFIATFSFLGQEIGSNSLNIVLPVGISFYTFQTLSYTIDIYNKKFEPTKDLISFVAYVSFFPQLVAGPIERAKHLLPQFYKKRRFQYEAAVDGLRQILWGFFKKVVIADNCAGIVELIFANSENHSSGLIFLAAILFFIQIYGDFSGYSDIAIGVAKLFGFHLKQNFAFPFFSRSIPEFWRRWHISLSTWLRDYVYIPLGGSRVSTLVWIRNIFIVFILNGFWHGANWTFIAWGTLNACYLLPHILLNKNDNIHHVHNSKSIFPSLKEILQMFLTFSLIAISLIFFRAENIDQALTMFHHLFSFTTSSASTFTFRNSLVTLFLTLFCIIIEWKGRTDKYAIEKILKNWHWILRFGFYYSILLLILMYFGKPKTFVYFQF